ncbi:hypothetical protein ACQPW3_34315 [Actinosynnema sp. CA-248983]
MREGVPGADFVSTLPAIPINRQSIPMAMELHPLSLVDEATVVPAEPVVWDVELPARLRAVAEPVFAGRRAVTPEPATAIRMGAALPALDPGDASPDSRRYGRLAAGVTLLERRAAGDEPADETIVLGVDRRNG